MIIFVSDLTKGFIKLCWVFSKNLCQFTFNSFSESQQWNIWSVGLPKEKSKGQSRYQILWNLGKLPVWHLKGVCLEIFYLNFFHDSNRSNKQATAFSNSFSISLLFSNFQENPRCGSHREVRLCGVHHNAESSSPVCIITRSQPAHRGVNIKILISGDSWKKYQVKSFYGWTHLSWKKRF